MNPITITKNLTKGDELVVISRKDYDLFCSAYETHRWAELEREAAEDIQKGKVSKAYRTKKELRRALAKLKR